MSAKKYPIATLRDMTGIPEEALPRFLAELPTIIAEAHRAYDAIDEMNAFLVADGVQISADAVAPVWVDDDLNTFTASIRVAGEAEPRVTATVKRRPNP